MIKKIGNGVFWDIYEWVIWKDAEDFLLEKKWWEVKGAYIYKWDAVDLVWWAYDEKTQEWFGLAKISEKHPEVLGNIQKLLDTLPEKSRTKNRIKLSDERAHISIRLEREWKQKSRILTAFMRE